MSPSVIRVPSSSGSSGEDDRKRKRRLSNRESARRSRQRKQKHETDLIDEIASLKRTVTEGKQKLANLVQAQSALEDEKKLLGNEKVRLEEELGYLNQVIHNFGGQLWSSSELDLIGFSEPSMLLNPWQFQESTNYHSPVVASGSMFSF